MRIVDLRKKPACPYVYAGCFMKFSPMGRMQASIYRNNFSKKQYGDQAIAMFRRDLWARLQDESTGIRAAILAIQADWTLACWCVDLEGEAIFTEPEVCHCQVIFKAARFLSPDRFPNCEVPK